MSNYKFDVAVVGGGIAGAAVAEALSTTMSVVLVEAESDFGVHATGRSAAMLTETYGGPEVQQLTRQSRPALERMSTDAGPVLSPRPVLWTGRTTDLLLPRLRRLTEGSDAPRVRWLDPARAAEIVSAIDPHRIELACLEPDAQTIDVDLLHRTFLRDARRQGATLLRNSAVVGMRRRATAWEVALAGRTLEVSLVVNAAGAWSDHVAAMASLPHASLVPKRRTVLVADTDPPTAPDWPFVVDLGDEYYFEASGSRVLASPADETPAEPGNARADDLDVAVCVERLHKRTRLRIRRITATWAGLRTFAADGLPVLGPHPDEPSFHWCAGLGGFGIMTAPAVAKIVADSILGHPASDLGRACLPGRTGLIE